jgi:hypothetical protein
MNKLKRGALVRTPKGAGTVRDTFGNGLVVVEVNGLLDAYRPEVLRKARETK